MSSASDVQWLIDRINIRDCLGRYTRGLDRHDAELIASAFWSDAHIDYGKQFTGERDVFVEWSNRSHAERWSQHSHNVTNQNVVFDEGRDGADVESYVQFFHRRLASDAVEVGIGRYLDRFERRGEEWRINARKIVVDMMFTTTAMPFEGAGFNIGAWGEGDPSYRRPYDSRKD